MKFIRNQYQRYKEIILYLVFGFMTTGVSILGFGIIYEGLGGNEHIANVLSWIMAVIFAYITNSIWVFRAAAGNWKMQISRLAGFFTGRLATLALEEGILLLFVTLLGMPAMLIKIAAQLLVIVMNYVISKLWVFRKSQIGDKGELK